MPDFIPSLHIDLERTWRGGQRQVYFLVRELRRDGHQAYLVSRKDSPLAKRLEDERLPVYTMRFFGEMDVMAARRIAKIAVKMGIRILHAHSSHAHTLALIAKRSVPGGRVIVHRRVDFKPGDDALNRWKYGSTDGYVAISNAIKDVLVDYGIDQKKITVIHSAVEPATPSDDARRKIREELGMDDETPLILNVAALVDHKGHKFLVGAMPKVLQHFPKAVCIVAGEGELKGDISKQIKSLDLQENLKLLGFRQDVPDLMAAADLYISTSHLEGLNSSLLDASMMGLPVVATRAGGQPEAVSDGVSGLLANNRDTEDIADKIIRILSNRELAAKLSRGGREYARQFTPQAMARQIAGFYERVAS